MKEFFSHDHNARNDQKLLRLQMKHGMEGVGVFWCICEMLAEEDGYIMRTECERIAFELRTSCDTVKSVIEDFGLFTLDDTKFYSESMLKRLKVKYDKSKKARESAQARWNKMNNANALQTHSDRNAIKLNKTDIKQNETKLNINPKKDLSVIDQNETDQNSFQIWWDLSVAWSGVRFFRFE